MTYSAVYTTSDGTLLAIVHGDLASNGFDWDAATMSAIDIGEDAPDLAVQAWDATAHAFVPDLDKLRAIKWQAIKDQREARRIVITTALGVFDADEIGKTNLLGRLAAINLGATDDVVWKLHDNSFVTIPAAQFPAACMAVMAGIEAVYAASFALEAALDAAETAEEIAAIDTMAGWPE